MDIKFENAFKKELFCNIGVGECFAVDLSTPDEMICMRIMGCGDESDNAVELQSGEAVHFDDDEEVILIDAELKVRLGG
jgi:hypothetical protein